MEKINVSEISGELSWKFGKNRISILIDKEELLISVSRGNFLANIPICTIVEKLSDQSVLTITNTNAVFMIGYHKEEKTLTFKDDKLYLYDTTDDSAVSIEL